MGGGERGVEELTPGRQAGGVVRRGDRASRLTTRTGWGLDWCRWTWVMMMMMMMMMVVVVMI